MGKVSMIKAENLRCIGEKLKILLTYRIKNKLKKALSKNKIHSLLWLETENLSIVAAQTIKLIRCCGSKYFVTSCKNTLFELAWGETKS